MDDSIKELLKGFGVTTSSEGDLVREVVARELGSRGIEAEVLELRYGRLTLSASAVHARLLTFDKDQVLSALEAEVPGAVQAIQVRTRR